MLPITSVTTAVFALMMVLLSLLVSFRRRRLQIVVGDGDDPTLRCRIRAHGNFTEYAPLALITIGILEFRGSPNIILGLLAATFVLSRILHAIGMLRFNAVAPRAIAMVLQHAAFTFAALYLLSQMVP